MRWRCDLDKPVLTQNFLRRGWIDVSAEATDDRGDWDLYWASVGSVKDLFSSECSVRLQPHQRINHFPNHYELTRKASCGLKELAVNCHKGGGPFGAAKSHCGKWGQKLRLQQHRRARPVRRCALLQHNVARMRSSYKQFRCTRP